MPPIPVHEVTLGQLAGWLVAAGVLLGGLRWLVPIVRAVHHMATDWNGTPKRDGVPARPGVMLQLECLDKRLTAIEKDRLTSIEAAAHDAAFHSQPNHGTSSYDALMRKIDELADRLPPKP